VARVLFIHTGGTLLMREGASGEPLAVAEEIARDLLKEVPSLAKVADVESRVLFNLDSGDMQPMHWIEIGRAVHAALSGDRYDGVVVVHGTDTMAYSASALALLLGPLPKPVVFTGAQRPLVDIRTDARQNLIDAALVSSMRVPEVSIVFASRAMRGARATKRDAWAFEAFESPNCAPLVKLGIGVDVAPHVRAPAPLGPLDERIEPRVLAVRVFPGIDPALVSGALRVGVRGLVLEAYGTGNLPLQFGSLIPALAEARDRGVPVVVVSQCFRGAVDMGRYAGSANAAKTGAIAGGDMTVEAAVAKLMIGLGRYGAGDELRAFLTRDVIGERSADVQA
jgi:L-asparaginase